MGYFMTGQDGATVSGVKEFVLTVPTAGSKPSIPEIEAELNKINVANLSPGSQVIVTNASMVLILNTEKEWDIL